MLIFIVIIYFDAAVLYMTALIMVGVLIVMAPIFILLALFEQTKSFFEKVFLELNFQSVLYLGKWERTFQILANINKMLLGSDLL